MGVKHAGAKTRWAVSVGAAALVMAAVVLLFRGPARPPGVPVHPIPVGRGSIRLGASRSDELAMRDLVPLYLPTVHNAAPGELRPLEPGRSFFERDAERLTFAPGAPGLSVRATYPVPATPLDALRDTPGPLALGMGREDVRIPVAPATGGHVDVYGGDARQAVLSLALPSDARPGTAGRDATGWRPLEFTAAVDHAGFVGPLLLTSSSGVEEVDTYFRNYLARSLRLGDRLGPGFYRIVVGP